MSFDYAAEPLKCAHFFVGKHQPGLPLNIVAQCTDCGSFDEESMNREVAKIKAEALREAARETDQEGIGANDGTNGGDWYPSEWAGQVEGWLTHRADRIEEEA